METPNAPLLFPAATLLPATSLFLAAIFGGSWVWIAFISMTLLVLIMDRLAYSIEAQASMAVWLPKTIAMAHFAVLGTGLWATGNSHLLSNGEKLLLVLTLGLFAGQVSNACAHELIHRPDRRSRALGTAVFCSLLNGHHVSAHMLVHHVHAGTAKDPNSAALGRGFYRFAMRASLQEFVAGWRAESKRRSIQSLGLHPYVIYLSGAALSLGVAAIIGGFWGCVSLCFIALHAQNQLMLSDYVQHYGLRRRLLPDGKPEPMGPQHSWNAPHPFSSALMMNAPRHSDHHMTPARRFVDLELSKHNMPTLPYSVPVMGALALVPPLWRRKMDPLVQQWSDTSEENGDTISLSRTHNASISSISPAKNPVTPK